MEQIIQELATLSDYQGQKLLKLIMEYGTKRWVEGFNKASDISGYGTPPEPTVRNEVRNAPIVNNPHPDGGNYGC